MPFRDEVEITVKAGDGGDGCVSFRREKYVAKGGPDGGDGGRGGDVVIVTATGLMSLESLAVSRRIVAGDGRPGGGRKSFGKNGDDAVIRVPPGTLIKDAERGNVLKDLDQPGASVVIALGGKGGRGNARFATSTDRVPRRFESGVPGEQRRLKLELKIIADTGLVGFPNAGKSTLLAALSSARPKIAPFPFTTLTPNVGIVEVDHEPFVIADVPGLIEGASDGKGLGDRFLRHVERTRVLLHLVDASSEVPVADAYEAVREEIRRYSEVLAEKPEILVLTKLDLLDEEERAALDEGLAPLEVRPGRRIHRVSSSSREGIPELLQDLVTAVLQARGGADAEESRPD